MAVLSLVFRKLLRGVAGAHTAFADKMLEKRVSLASYLRAVEALTAAEHSVIEACFGSPLGKCH